jgi:hypothetical protein
MSANGMRGCCLRCGEYCCLPDACWVDVTATVAVGDAALFPNLPTPGGTGCVAKAVLVASSVPTITTRCHRVDCYSTGYRCTDGVGNPAVWTFRSAPFEVSWQILDEDDNPVTTAAVESCFQVELLTNGEGLPGVNRCYRQATVVIAAIKGTKVYGPPPFGPLTCIPEDVTPPLDGAGGHYLLVGGVVPVGTFATDPYADHTDAWPASVYVDPAAQPYYDGTLYQLAYGGTPVNKVVQYRSTAQCYFDPEEQRCRARWSTPTVFAVHDTIPDGAGLNGWMYGISDGNCVADYYVFQVCEGSGNALCAGLPPDPAGFDVQCCGTDDDCVGCETCVCYTWTYVDNALSGPTVGFASDCPGPSDTGWVFVPGTGWQRTICVCQGEGPPDEPPLPPQPPGECACTHYDITLFLDNGPGLEDDETVLMPGIPLGSIYLIWDGDGWVVYHDGQTSEPIDFDANGCPVEGTYAFPGGHLEIACASVIEG